MKVDMQLQISHRDGNARIGLFKHEDILYEIPNIITSETNNMEIKEVDKSLSLHIGTNIFFQKQKESGISDFLVDSYLALPGDLPIESYTEWGQLIEKNGSTIVLPPDLAYIKQEKFDEKTSLAIVSYALQMLNHQTSATKYLITLRGKLPIDTLLYLPGVALPSNLALLCYFGVDLFDMQRLHFAALNNILLFSEGIFPQKNIKSNPCLCSTCISKDIQDLSCKDIEKHNRLMLLSEIRFVKNAIFNGSLRELVEIRVRANPQLSAMLHLLDINHFDFFEQVTPMYRRNGIVATTSDALWRPEVHRFQRRVCEWFEKPLSAKVLVLLPCSARKPYSRSKTHKRIHSFLGMIRNYNLIHEVIVTSPIGIVPRELESIYPASSYDISVSGLWTRDEQFIIRSVLDEYLNRNRYDHVIIHLPEDMQVFLTDIFDSYSVTCVDSPTSEVSLKNLVEIATKKCSDYSAIPFDRVRWESVRSLLSYQFGVKIADAILNKSTVKGRGPQYKIFRDDHQLGMISLPRSFVSLTLKGAEVLYQCQKNWVKIDDSFQLKGSVFAPGVVAADKGIRIGDEVCVIQNDQVQGAGVAQMPGSHMIISRYGEAVKLRHHAGI